MSHQKTLFPDPEPERHGPISEPLDPNVMYGTLEDDYDESFWKLSEQPTETAIVETPPVSHSPDQLPFGIAAYVQELYEKWRPRIGETLATRRVVRIVNDYHQIEAPQ